MDEDEARGGTAPEGTHHEAPTSVGPDAVAGDGPDGHTDEHPVAPTKRRRIGLVLGIVGSVLLSAAVVGGVVWGWHAYATARTDVAYQEATAASKALADVTDERGTALNKATFSVTSLKEFTDHARPAYLSESAAAALAASRTRLEKATAGLDPIRFDPPTVRAATADLMPWTVIADVQGKRTLIRDENDDRRTRAAELAALEAAQKDLGASADAVYAELKAHGEQVMTADDAATYASKVDLKHAIDAGTSGVTTSQFGGAGLLQIATAIDAVDAAQAAGLAARQDPAYPVRAQIEEYARSIAHGVTLDFEWHAQVSGLGEGWYSGTTVYHREDGGWATIDLNFPLQDGWTSGDIDARALVTHEVGHAQVVRPECEALFASGTFNYDDEMWATAWAIAMGFDTGGSGIDAYGRPSDEQIAVAGQCR
ncbi:hypothetical protein ACFVU2_18115 [Leifsonia sp. NPDC058194]|uniref:hypothetical protein n=1 Tax=Leifsonia sp. NPDC058194 TaxID=3346374 RepID=UPI0036DC2FC3